MIQFQCPCGRKLQARDENAGMEVACPACGRRQVVPGSEAVQVEPDLGPTAVRRERPAIGGEDEYPRPDQPLGEPPAASGKAIASLVLGVVSFLFSLLAGIPALILGILALRDVRMSRGRVVGGGMAVAGIVLAGVSTLCWGGYVLLLFPAVSKVREAAARTQSNNNLRQMGIAMHGYHDAYGRFPAAASYSPKGKPLLSWRVEILPFIGENNLYNQFARDEPWDSPANKPLLNLMPKVYKLPGDNDLPPDHTVYRVFEGPGAAFEGRKGHSMQEFLDGTSNTVLVVEADRGVPWTKPDELPFNPNQPVPRPQGHWASGFQALLADGAARFIEKNMSEQTLRAAITRDGGEIMGPDW
jgi:DNA-directed RNA polymerase subunit RPC12/RpoP